MQRIDLSGRVALITGASRGIGLAIAQRLAAAGATVVLNARTIDEEIIATFDGPQAQVFVLRGDVGQPEAVGQLIKTIFSRHKRLDILVNNAGAAQRASVMELELADWKGVLDANLTGAFLCTKHAARRMREQGRGKIVNIASVYGLVAPSRGLQGAYTAAKHGLIGLTRANAVELAPLGIQVNAIAPGWFWSEMTEELRATPFEQAVERRTPSGRWGEPGDLGGACVFLASAAADHVSGIVLPVDGGYGASDGLERG